MTDFVISSGVSSSNIVLNSGDSLNVSGGGVASGVLVHFGGFVTVNGVVSGLTLDVGSGLTYGGGAFVNGTVVGAVVSANALLGDLYTGVISNVTVKSGGSVDLMGVAPTNLTISSGGHLIFRPVVSVSSGYFTFLEHIFAVSSGQSITAGQVNSTVSFGGATLLSGATWELDQLTVQGGGSVTLLSGTTASGMIVASGGVMTVQSGALVDVLTVSAGGIVSGPGTIQSDPNFSNDDNTKVAGTLSGLTVSLISGDGLEVLSGGLAAGLDVQLGGMVVSAGGVASGIVLNGVGNVATGERVYGLALDTIVSGNGFYAGQQYIDTGGQRHLRPVGNQ